jgi:hypothetical protein
MPSSKNKMKAYEAVIIKKDGDTNRGPFELATHVCDFLMVLVTVLHA